MPDRKAMVEAINAYCRAESENDWASWINLFTPDIIHEEPVSVVTRQGYEELKSLWSQITSVEFNLHAEHVIVCGNEAVAIMYTEIGPTGAKHKFGPVVDHFVFDDAGKISKVRVFLESPSSQ